MQIEPYIIIVRHTQLLATVVVTWCMMMNRSPRFTCCLFDSTGKIQNQWKSKRRHYSQRFGSSGFATLENALVLVSFWRTPSLLTPANVLIISLAMTDLGTGLVSAPLFFISNIAKHTENERHFCKITPVYFLAAISLSCISLLTLLWLMWLIGVSVAAAAIASTIRLVIDVVSVILIPLCLGTTAFCYIKIHRVVRRHQAQISAQIPGQTGPQQDENSFDLKAFKKSFVDMLVIYVLFLVHFTPQVVVSLILLARGAAVRVYAAADLAEAILLLNSALNPLLYCWRSQAIRSAVKETAQKVLCRRPTQAE